MASDGGLGCLRSSFSACFLARPICSPRFVRGGPCERRCSLSLRADLSVGHQAWTDEPTCVERRAAVSFTVSHHYVFAHVGGCRTAPSAPSRILQRNLFRSVVHVELCVCRRRRCGCVSRRRSCGCDCESSLRCWLPPHSGECAGASPLGVRWQRPHCCVHRLNRYNSVRPKKIKDFRWRMNSSGAFQGFTPWMRRSFVVDYCVVSAYKRKEETALGEPLMIASLLTLPPGRVLVMS